MKILIFEYLTGGGFCSTQLPTSLAREGGLMLNALLNDFASLAEHEIVVMLDVRCVAEFADKNIRVIAVDSTDNIEVIFDNALKECDAAWVIAPETDHILFNLTKRVEKLNKLLLSNPSSAIAKTADKLQTFQLLIDNNILTIPTRRLSEFSGFEKQEKFPLVVKSIDGVGCENNFFIQNKIELHQIKQQINQPDNYIIQPFIKGDALSVSAIFKQGTAQLICINRQYLEIENQQFKLTGCEVNITVANRKPFQQLLNKTAQVFPDLFGYVGIDLIAADLIYLVEINPRLTSSYSGIDSALGINIADLVLNSISDTVQPKPIHNQSVFINLS